MWIPHYIELPNILVKFLWDLTQFLTAYLMLVQSISTFFAKIQVFKFTWYVELPIAYFLSVLNQAKLIYKWIMDSVKQGDFPVTSLRLVTGIEKSTYQLKQPQNGRFFLKFVHFNLSTNRMFNGFMKKNSFYIFLSNNTIQYRVIIHAT